MANLVQAQKKIAILHRYPKDRIEETNASFPHIVSILTAPWWSDPDLRAGAINIIKRHTVDVLTFKKFDRLSSTHKFWKSVAWILYAPFLVFGKKYDIIYCDDSYPFYPALVKLASPKSKVIIRLGDLHILYYYSGLTYSILHFLQLLAWRCTDGIIAISDPMVRFIERELGMEPYTWMVPDPVSVPTSTKADKGYAITNKGKKKCVMFHGVLTKNKNVDMLLEAAKAMPNVLFRIVGSGPEYKRLLSIAPSNVLMYGWVPFKYIPHYISHATVGVALRSENLGNEFVVTSPYLQYGVMGKPCLVTRREVFGDYKWQFSGVDELVQKLQALLSMSEARRTAEGEKLRKHIIQNHEAKTVAEEICGILLSA